MIQTDPIEQYGRQYRKVSLWIIVALFLVGLLYVQVGNQPKYLNALSISAIFSLLCSIALGMSWQSVAKHSPKMLTKFYLVAPALRMLAAIAVFALYCVAVRERSAVLGFTVIFLIFYIVLLVYDCIFFARIEKHNKQ